jgi:hypothetical protein
MGMSAGEFVTALWRGGSTYMLNKQTGHTNDGAAPYVHHEDNAFQDCSGCKKEGWT